MPGFDGTGPRGTGPMTGFGGGYCIVVLDTPEEELELLRKQARFQQGRFTRYRAAFKAIQESGRCNMPGFDGTGPGGAGPMTGGGRGFCGAGGFRAMRRPYGFGRWSGYGYPLGTMPAGEREVDVLREEARRLRMALEDIDARLKELSGEAK